MPPIMQAIAQALLAFALTYTVVRMLGKMEVAQGTFWDFTSAIVLGSLGATLATTGIAGLSPLAAVVITWGFLTFSIGWAALKHRGLRGLLESKPTVIVHNGKILERQMAKERYNLDMLSAELRKNKVASLSDVEFAILESNGNLSVILKSQKRPLTPSDINLPTRYTGLATELIVDGQLIRQNLKQVNLSEEWLRAELARRGVTELDQVMLASLDTQGRLYVDLRRDPLESVHRPGDVLH